MYSADDIEKMLVEARKNKEEVRVIIESSAYGMDKVVLQEILSDADFVAETFGIYVCRVDSDVCEQFITIMEKWRKKESGQDGWYWKREYQNEDGEWVIETSNYMDKKSAETYCERWNRSHSIDVGDCYLMYDKDFDK